MSMQPTPMQDIDRAMLRLRGRGLPYTAIAEVLDLYHGWRLDSEQIRRRCLNLGAAPARGGNRAARRQITEGAA